MLKRRITTSRVFEVRAPLSGAKLSPLKLRRKKKKRKLTRSATKFVRSNANADGFDFQRQPISFKDRKKIKCSKGCSLLRLNTKPIRICLFTSTPIAAPVKKVGFAFFCIPLDFFSPVKNSLHSFHHAAGEILPPFSQTTILSAKCFFFQYLSLKRSLLSVHTDFSERTPS